jgi:hypothetical protein
VARCPGCGNEVDAGVGSCPSCGRKLFDAPDPPPSNWLPGAPLFGRGSTYDPNAVVIPTPRRNKTGCGVGVVVIVVLVAIIGVVVAVAVSIGRSVNHAVSDAFDTGGDVAGEALVVDRPVDGHLGSDDTGVHPLRGIEGRVTITVAGGDAFDPVLQVVDADGTVVGENDDADGLDSRLSLILSTSDDLDVRVREWNGDAGDYTVTVLRGDEVVGISPLDGGQLTVRTEVDGSVGENQATAYRFTGEGLPVTIKVAGLDDFDPMVRVLDEDGKELGVDDDGGGGVNARLEILVPGATHVTIEVTGYAGQAGSYSIVVQ